jgi:SprB repeat/PKD-like domain/Bacterial Ig domain/NHL repeat
MMSNINIERITSGKMITKNANLVFKSHLLSLYRIMLTYIVRQWSSLEKSHHQNNASSFVLSSRVGQVFRLLFLLVSSLLGHQQVQSQITNGQKAVDLIGQYTTTAGFVNNWTQSTANNNNGSVYGLGFNNPIDPALDKVNHRLFVGDIFNHRILVYNLDASNQLVDKTPDFVLGQTNFTSGSSGASQSRMNQPAALAYDEINQRLFVTELSNHRVLVFDVVAITNGENAVAVLGQTNYTNNASGLSQSRMNLPNGISYDSSNQRLFVSDQGNHRVLVFNVSAITNGENAVAVLGQTNYTTGSSGLTQSKFNVPTASSYDAINQRLFVCDNSNNRIMIFDVEAITNGQNAINVIGQSNFTTNTPGATQSKISITTTGVYIDPTTDWLFLSDGDNNRVLVFDVASLTNGENAVYVLGQPNFTTNTASTSQAGFNACGGLIYNSANKLLLVTDYINNRYVIYDLNLTVNGVVTNATCNDGAINISLINGTAPFSYVWSDGSTNEDRTNLAPGSYTVTVTDNLGATASATFTVGATLPYDINDTDGDGVLNGCDLDDDNDGIKSYDEEVNENLSSVQWPGGTYVAQITTPPFSSAEVLSAGSGLNLSLSGSLYVMSGIDANTFAEAVSNNEFLQVGFTLQNNILNYMIQQINFTNRSPGAQDNWRFTLLLTDNNFSTNQVLIDDVLHDNGQGLGQFLYLFANNVFTELGKDRTLSGSTAYKLRFYVYNAGGPSNSIEFDDLRIQTKVRTDTDRDNTPNYLDTDSDNDLGYDAIEGGANFTALDIDANGRLTGTVESNGLPTIAGGGQTIGGSRIAAQLAVNAAPLSQLVGVPDSAFFYIITTASNATGYTGTAPNTTPVYGSAGNGNPQTVNQWYLGNPDLPSSTMLVDNSIYYGVNNDTLKISNSTGLIGNDYYVEVTHLNNTYIREVRSASLLASCNLTATVTKTDVTCYGQNTGSITVSAPSGGSGSYEYRLNLDSWQPTGTFTGLIAGSYLVQIRDANDPTCEVELGIEDITQPSSMVASGFLTQVTCAGIDDGSITQMIFGGTSPYSYVWSDGGATSKDRTMLSGGTYAVTVTDGLNCSATKSYYIYEPPTLNVVAVVSQPSCGVAGSIVLTVSGGSAPYTYDWSDISGIENEDSRANLAFGTYSLTVTDATGCTYTETYILNDPGCGIAEIVCIGFNATSTYSVAPDPFVTIYNWTLPVGAVIVSGVGTPSIEVNWNGAQPGIDSICVETENICGESGTYCQPVLLKRVTAMALADLACVGDNLQLRSLGGVSYEWSGPGSYSSFVQNPLLSNVTSGDEGNYQVTVTDEDGCMNTAIVTVTVHPEFTLSTTVSVAACGQSIGAIDLDVIGGTMPYTYQWNNGSTTEDLTDLSSDNYIVTVTDANGCREILGESVDDIEGPTISAVVNNVSCNKGTDGMIDVTVGGGSPPYIYQWNNGATTQDISSLKPSLYSLIVIDTLGCKAGLSRFVNQPNPIQVSINRITPTCFGSANGNITLSVSGGSPVYSYTWSDGGPDSAIRSGITAGIYNVTITDNNGCTVTRIIGISQPVALSQNTTVRNVVCSGGANGIVNLTVLGGTEPYSYAWTGPSGYSATSKDLAGIIAGSYAVTVTDANGCTVSGGGIVVGAPSAVSITATSTNLLCNGASTGSIDATVSGGNGGYQYTWSNGSMTEDIIGLKAGSYTLSVRDSLGCTATITRFINQPNPIQVSITKSNISCFGTSDGSITLGVSGGTAGYNYTWSDNVVNSNSRVGLAAGLYRVTISDTNGCTVSRLIALVQPTELQSNVTASAVSCSGANNGNLSLSVSGGTTPYSYSWTGPGGYSATTEDLIGVGSGSYAVTVIDAKGCQRTHSSEVVSEPTPLNITSVQTSVSCNGGTSGSIDATVSGGNGGYQYTWSNGSTSEDISGLKAGSYVLSVRDALGCTATVTRFVNQPNPLQVLITKTNSSCFGASDGSITLSVSGGTAGYSYEWSGTGSGTNTKSNIIAGLHRVTITDSNGCSATRLIAITQPTELQSFVTSSGVVCSSQNNGSVRLTVSGGATPYSFTWGGPNGYSATSQDISGLLSGSYTVTITDGQGCTITNSSAVVSEPTPVSVTSVPTNVTCNGGQDGAINTTVMGGSGTKSYTWSNGATTEDIIGLKAGSYTVNVRDSLGCTATATRFINQPNPIQVVITKTNPSCFGVSSGSITLAVSGGTPTYNYTWSDSGVNTNTRTALAAGIYRVTITDNSGCTATRLIAITQPTELQSTATVVNTECVGQGNGSVSVIVSGGATPYSYLWSGPSGYSATSKDISELMAGSYSVTITDAQGCTTTQTGVTVSEPSALSLMTVPTNVLCNGAQTGAIDATVTGGSGTKTYTWSNGATTEDISGLKAGSYTLSVRDSLGCTATATRFVNQPNPIQVVITKTNPSCFGISNGSITLTVSGGSPGYSYSWSDNGPATNARTALAAGIYRVTITDNSGCSVQRLIVISQPISMQSYATVIPVLCAGGSSGAMTLTVLGGTLPHSYSWSGPNGFSATSKDITGLDVGIYQLTVSDANGCTLTQSYEIVVTTPLGVTGVATDASCIQSTDGSITVNVIGGQSPYTYGWSHGADAGIVTGLAAGSYTVTVSDRNGCSGIGNFDITEPNEMILTSTVTPNCDANSNGTISLNVSGGNGIYSYSWTGAGSGSNPRTGLGTGDYYVTVTDGKGCMVMDSFELKPLVAEYIKEDRTCSFVNGRSVVAATGGLEPYSYQWSTGSTASYIENLDVGTYSVTVNAGGCTKSGSVTVSVPSNCSPPDGRDDHYTTVVNVIVSGTVMPADPMNAGYDSDPFYPLDSLKFENIEPLEDSLGTITWDNGGVFEYTPSVDYIGSFTLEYEVCNLLKLCDSAFLRITVGPLDNPFYHPDYGVTYVNVPLTGDVSTNDETEEGTTYSNPPANPSNPDTCTPVVSSDGSYTFLCGTKGIYSFYVPACEPAPAQSKCTSVLLQITVLEENIPTAEPIANPDYVRTLQDVSVSIPVRNNDKCQNGPSCTLGIPTIITAPLHGVYNSSTGNYDPNVNFVGLDSLKYQVCDNQVPSKCAQSWAYISINPTGITNMTNAMDDYAQSIFNMPISGNVKGNDNDPEGDIQTVTAQNTTIPGKGTLVLDNTGAFTFTPALDYYGSIDFPYRTCDDGTPQACAMATLHILVQPRLCITPNLKVLLEGPYVDNGSNGATMTTKLNELGYLPGQKPSTFFGIATPSGQPYNESPWNYNGVEGAEYSYSPGIPATYKANYPTTTTDWVLVQLRETTSVTTTVCTKAALLLSNGTVQMVSGFDCCDLDLTKTYYVVVEHRNHLMVMSHVKVGIINNSITYDFTAQQSFKGLLGFGQSLINGKYVMYAGNGQQSITSSADTDINVNDKDAWLFQNGLNSRYYKNDLELNGDVNVQDKNNWLINIGRFSDVPR